MKKSTIVHFGLWYALAVLLQQFWDYNIEFLIVIFIAYEIGYTIPAIDATIASNDKFIKKLKRLFKENTRNRKS